MKLLGRKGITLVETIIAMTLLVILTAISLELSLSSTIITSNSKYRFIAVNMTNDLIEIFQEADDNDHFQELVRTIYNVEFDREPNGAISFEYDNVTYHILNAGNIILIDCYDSDRDHKYYEYSYLKGEK